MAERGRSRNVSSNPFECVGCKQSFLRSSNRQKRCPECKRKHLAEKERQRKANFSPAQAASKKEYDRAYRLAHAERLRELDRQRYQDDIRADKAAVRAAALVRGRAYRQRQRDKKLAGGWEPRVPMTKAERAERKRKRAVERYHADPLRWRMAAAIKRVLRQEKARTSWLDLVDYTLEELRDHIEKQFTTGMTWDRLKAGEIHIDHIVPLSSFNYSDPSEPDFKAAWALTNLRPLWARDNLKKYCRRTHLL